MSGAAVPEKTQTPLTAIGRRYEVLLALELALILLPSTVVFLYLSSWLLPGGFLSSLMSLEGLAAITMPFGGLCLVLTWYGALRLLTRGRGGLAAIHPWVAMVGGVGLAWVALTWILPRLITVDSDAHAMVAVFVFMGGFLATPSALVGLHLLIEWYVARRGDGHQGGR